VVCQPARSKISTACAPTATAAEISVEMKLHRLGVGVRQRQRRADAAGGTDGAEQIGALVTLVGRLARGAFLGAPIAARGRSSARRGASS